MTDKQQDINAWGFGPAHLLHYGNTGTETATRSPVPHSIRYRRAGTRIFLPTAPFGPLEVEGLVIHIAALTRL